MSSESIWTLDETYKEKCTTCEKMFSSSEKLRAHIAADHGNGNYCNFCEEPSQINHLWENIYKILTTTDVIFVSQHLIREKC